LSTKVHVLTDGKGRPLVLLITPGQGGDAPMLTHLMGKLRIERNPHLARVQSGLLRVARAAHVGRGDAHVARRVAALDSALLRRRGEATGLPNGVAAPVTAIGPDFVELDLIIFETETAHTVVVQVVSFGEHRFGTVSVDTGEGIPVGGP